MSIRRFPLAAGWYARRGGMPTHYMRVGARSTTACGLRLYRAEVPEKVLPREKREAKRCLACVRILAEDPRP